MVGDPIGAGVKGVIDTTKRVVVDGVQGAASTVSNTAQTAMNVDTSPDHNPFLHASKAAGEFLGGAVKTGAQMASTTLSGLGQTAMNVGSEIFTQGPSSNIPGGNGGSRERV